MSDAVARFGWRGWLVALVFAAAGVALAGRALWLQVIDKDFLLSQGDARHLRVVSVPAHRGTITDRNGEVLAVSTPVESISANPQELLAQPTRHGALARALGMQAGALRKHLDEKAGREFVYLKRHLSPEQAAKVMALKVPGVYSQREYRRYYPAGEVTAQALGLANIDDIGQEGVELAFDEVLRGEPGAERVVKDRLGRTIAEVERLRAPRHGRDLRLALDLRIQFLAYRELKRVVFENEAIGGSIVVLDTQTGEILAMASQPAWNPNGRGNAPRGAVRNRVATDLFEPGSAFKPFPIAVALESGSYRPRTLIDTHGGVLKVGSLTLKDEKDFGLIDVTTVLTKSVNTGSAQIALSLDRGLLWQSLTRFGFGSETGSGFPGEQSGNLPHYQRWRSVHTATLSYGYGLNVTLLQLAQAYAVIAADGVRRTPALLPNNGVVQGERVLSVRTATELRSMMETVVSTEGTAQRASVKGYRVSGKTGTARKAVAGGYDAERHHALFAGMAPATAPRLVAVVMVDEPSLGKYHGGDVAAPAFARVMEGALRLMDVPPDALDATGAVNAPLHSPKTIRARRPR